MNGTPQPGPLRVRSEEQAMELLAKLRRYHGLTQQALGARVHASAITVRRREHCERGTYTAAFIETARALGYDVALVPRENS